MRKLGLLTLSLALVAVSFATFKIVNAQDGTIGTDITPAPSDEPSNFIIQQVDGKCPEGYLVAKDDNCIKYIPPIPLPEIIGEGGATPTTPPAAGGQTIPPTGVVTGVSGVGIVHPIDGKCPKGYTINTFESGEECVKPLLPTIIATPTKVAPGPLMQEEESAKTVIFSYGEGKGGKASEVTVKDRSTNEEARVTPTEGLRVIVSKPAEGPAGVVKEVSVEVLPLEMGIGEILITSQGAAASTKEKIKVEEDKIYMKEKELKVMPDTASEVAIKKLGEKYVEIELKDTGKGDEVQPVYEVKAKKKAKLFGLFGIKMTIETAVDAESGKVSKVKKPWWNFLASVD